MNKSFLNNVTDDNFRKKQMSRILEMEKFVNNNGCRMQYITNYFNEKIKSCGHCDFCLSNNVEVKTDITRECYYILKTIKKLKNNFGTIMICDIVYGSDSKKMNSSIKETSTYGKLNNIKKDRIKEIIRFLIMNNYLMEVKLEKTFGSVIKICEKGSEWANVKLDAITDKIYEINIQKKNEHLNIPNEDLENKLKEFRKNKASEEGRELYQIFPNKTIESLLNIRINNIEELLKIDGFGPKRIEKYGKNILNILNDQPLEETPQQTVIDKLLSAGLTLSEIKSLKNEITL